MKAARINKHVFSTVAGCIISIILAPTIARADFLVRPVPVQFVPVQVMACQRCDICHRCVYLGRPHYHKNHHTIRKHHKHYRHHRYHSRYYPQCAEPRDFVTFIGGPAPRNRGRWLIDKYDNYDLDRATGDDDPTIYPGMDIDN